MAKKATKTGGKPLVVSYLRFSHPQQATGDSIRRQTSLSEKWATAHGLKIDDTLRDRGVSGFRGLNRTTGALGTFLGLVKDGTIPPGSILLVEALDRLSREETLTALATFISIIQSGIRIVTLLDGAEYDRDSCDAQALMFSVMSLSRGNQESAYKSKRLVEAWSAKRERLTSKGELLTSKLPGWLTVRDGKIVADKVKANTVQRIFALAKDGHGLHQICQRANRAGWPVLGRTDKFSRSYVHLLLTNKAVIGHFQPERLVYDATGRKTTEPVGNPVADYYPAVVDEQTFYAVQQQLRQRRRTGGPTARQTNLFRGLLYDLERPGNRLQIIASGKGILDRRYVSAAAIAGVPGAAWIGFPVALFEAAVLEYLTEFHSLSLGTKDATKELRADLEATEFKLSEVKKRAGEIQASADGDPSLQTATVVRWLAQLDQQQQQLTERAESLKQELYRASRTTAAGTFNEISRILERTALAMLDDEQRTTLARLIVQLIERIDCQFAKYDAQGNPAKAKNCTRLECRATVKFRTGDSASFTIKTCRQSYTLVTEHGETSLTVLTDPEEQGFAEEMAEADD